ncbi:15331_t:CDS:1, partial [Funneliformis mosseae]
TILARDKEVIAVWLVPTPNGRMAYLSKNSAWLPNDIEYINKITTHLKKISKSASVISKNSKNSDFALIDDIFRYCSTKFKSRLEKLKKDIKMGQEKSHNYVISFIDYASISVSEIDTMKKSKIYSLCNKFYDKVKKDSEDSTFHPKFLGHIKKVGSYIGSVREIIACARKEKYKLLFSNIQVCRMPPIIIDDQPIFSWKRRWADDSDYKHFTDK